MPRNPGSLAPTVKKNESNFFEQIYEFRIWDTSIWCRMSLKDHIACAINRIIRFYKIRIIAWAFVNFPSWSLITEYAEGCLQTKPNMVHMALENRHAVSNTWSLIKNNTSSIKDRLLKKVTDRHLMQYFSSNTTYLALKQFSQTISHATRVYISKWVFPVLSIPSIHQLFLVSIATI